MLLTTPLDESLKWHHPAKVTLSDKVNENSVFVFDARNGNQCPMAILMVPVKIHRCYIMRSLAPVPILQTWHDVTMPLLTHARPTMRYVVPLFSQSMNNFNQF